VVAHALPAVFALPRKYLRLNRNHLLLEVAEAAVLVVEAAVLVVVEAAEVARRDLSKGQVSRRVLVVLRC